MQAESGTKGKLTVALWHGPGEPPPERLLSALKAKGIPTVEVTSAHAALAEVCSRLDLPMEGGKRPFGIVAVFPERLPDADALWEVLARYAPGTRCWGYGPAGMPNPRLSPIVEPKKPYPIEDEPVGPPAAVGKGNVAPRPPAQTNLQARTEVVPRGAAAKPGVAGTMPSKVVEPKLKLTGPVGVDRGPGEADLRLRDDDSEGDGPPRRPLLSAEELSMLLGEEGDDRE
jgi:hypothetical protein